MTAASLRAISLVVLVIVAGIAAYTDTKSTKIHNVLTYPVAVLGVAINALRDGAFGAGYAIAGGIICGLVPLLIFIKTRQGGGDVKFFVAAGCLLQPETGLEFQFLAFFFAALGSLFVLAWKGKMLRTLGNTLYVAFNPVMPPSWRRSVSRENMAMVRMGIPFLIAAAASAFLNWPFGAALFSGARN